MIEARSPKPARVAVVTGASRGLGAVVSKFLADRGYALIVTSRGGEELNALAAALRARGGLVIALAGDVSDSGHRRQVIGAATLWGRLDLLLNNASELGATPLPSLGGAKLEDVRHVFEVNTVGPLALVQEAAALLQASRGLVVNITSDAAVGGYPGWGVYGASKAALDLVSKTLAAELKPMGVGVVTVDPGDMRTKMHQDAYPGQDISDRPLPEVTLPFFAWLLSQDPLAVTGARFQAQGALWEVPA